MNMNVIMNYTQKKSYILWDWDETAWTGTVQCRKVRMKNEKSVLARLMTNSVCMKGENWPGGEKSFIYFTMNVNIMGTTNNNC